MLQADHQPHTYVYSLCRIWGPSSKEQPSVGEEPQQKEKEHDGEKEEEEEEVLEWMEQLEEVSSCSQQKVGEVCAPVNCKFTSVKQECSHQNRDQFTSV